MNITNLTINQLSQKLQDKELSSTELVQAYLDNIEKLNPKLNAYITVFKNDALKKAQQIDNKRNSGEKLSPYAGIPIAVKDNICIKDTRTTCASKILDNFKPPYNAAVIDKINQHDLIVLGKTNMDEFAMGSSTETSAYGNTLNPHNPEYIPGGSSGGSACAVAAKMAPWALGSDTGGSIRQPASHCGVVGLKPTYGLVSRYGLIAFASSLDQIGTFSNNIEDSAILMNIISGYDNKDSTSIAIENPDYTENIGNINLNELKIGVPEEYFTNDIDSEVKSIIINKIDKLKEKGAEIIDIKLPNTKYVVAVYYIIAPSEASSNLARYDGVKYGYRDETPDNLIDMYLKTRSAGFGQEVKRRIILGTFNLSSGYYDAYYSKALKVRTLIKNDFKNAFEQCNVIMSPVSPIPPFKIGEKFNDPLQMYLSDIFTLSANLAGIPGISVPAGKTTNGLPVGIQLMVNAFKEKFLLDISHKVMSL